jgi:hypothetical protein
LILVTPGGFQHFFEDVSALSEGAAAPELARLAPLAKQYGIQLLGPPLS